MVSRKGFLSYQLFLIMLSCDHVILAFTLGPKKCRHTQTTKLVPLGLAYSCYSYLGIECSNTWTWDQDQAG